mmetsp:Transcript_7145/g.16518  ORF Transcript_7145/g.16518 Transcript_7145/m.16518 type:complete len:248 (-) Transcript_7145:215-958(-)
MLRSLGGTCFSTVPFSTDRVSTRRFDPGGFRTRRVRESLLVHAWLKGVREGPLASRRSAGRVCLLRGRWLPASLGLVRLCWALGLRAGGARSGGLRASWGKYQLVVSPSTRGSGVGLPQDPIGGIAGLRWSISPLLCRLRPQRSFWPLRPLWPSRPARLLRRGRGACVRSLRLGRLRATLRSGGLPNSRLHAGRRRSSVDSGGNVAAWLISRFPLCSWRGSSLHLRHGIGAHELSGLLVDLCIQSIR